VSMTEYEPYDDESERRGRGRPPGGNKQMRELFALHVASGLSNNRALTEAGWRGTRGALAVAATRLAKEPDVIAMIRDFKRQIRERAIDAAGFRLADVMTELGKIAFFNIHDIMRVAGQSAYIDFSKAESHHFAAIQSIETELIPNKNGDEDNPLVLKTKVKMHDKKGALVDLARAMGAFDEDGRGNLFRPDDDGDSDDYGDMPENLKRREDAKRVAFFLRQEAELSKRDAANQPQQIEGEAIDVSHETNAVAVVNREAEEDDAFFGMEDD
jgi:Terminase small subunit